MVKKSNKITAAKKSKLNFAAKKHSTKNSSKENLLNDDLILSLADAYENKRARQINEWEFMQKRNFQQAA